MMNKTYKDLSPQDEFELVLWLGFLKDSVRNASMQMKRWRLAANSWDLQMFFVAVHSAYVASCKLESGLLSSDKEIHDILEKFTKRSDGYNLKG